MNNKQTMDQVVLKYLEFYGCGEYHELYGECEIYDWSMSMTDMDRLLDNMICNKQIKSYTVYVNDNKIYTVYVPYTAEVKVE